MSGHTTDAGAIKGRYKIPNRFPVHSTADADAAPALPRVTLYLPERLP
jgi:hypothetical protein